MERRALLYALLMVGAFFIAGPVFASSSASCSLNGKWEHQSHVCASFICCANGGNPVWKTGIAKDAARDCALFGGPSNACSDTTLDTANHLPLSTLITNTAKAGHYPVAQTQCRYDKECDGE